MENKIIEIWKIYPKYSKYEVSNFGNIRNTNGRLRYPSDNGHGYKRITIVINGKHKTLYIHRAVLETFSPVENSNNLDINHIDFNRGNNKLENLEWVSHLDNMKVSFNNGNFSNRDKKRSDEFRKLGDAGNHKWSKLNKNQIEEIYNLWITNNYTYTELGSMYNVTGQAIKYAIKRWENGRYK